MKFSFDGIVSKIISENTKVKVKVSDLLRFRSLLSPEDTEEDDVETIFPSEVSVPSPEESQRQDDQQSNRFVIPGLF